MWIGLAVLRHDDRRRSHVPADGDQIALGDFKTPSAPSTRLEVGDTCRCGWVGYVGCGPDITHLQR